MKFNETEQPKPSLRLQGVEASVELLVEVQVQVEVEVAVAVVVKWNRIAVVSETH